MSKDSTTNVATSSANLLKEAEQPRATKKEKNANQGVASDALKPSTTAQDPSIEKEAPKTMEIVLATMPLPMKSDLVSKGPEASEVASTQPTNGFKGKTCNKKEVGFNVFLLFMLFVSSSSFTFTCNFFFNSQIL